MNSPLVTRQRVLFSAVFLGLGVALAGIALVRGEPQTRTRYEVSGKKPTVTAAELADWGVGGKRDYLVIDLRPTEDFADGHIRGAVSCGSCHHDAAEAKKEQEKEFIDLTKKLVVYTETGTESVALPKVLAQNTHLYLLAGGYEGWKAQVMAPVAFGGEMDAAELAAKQKREAVRAFYAGERPASGHVADLPVAPIKRDTAHAPAKAAEGC